jgi:hypothetical protein
MIDLTPHFHHMVWREMGHSFGCLVGSDFSDKPADDPVFGLYKNCGTFTREEADLLYRCAQQVAPGAGLDIGSHVGFSTAHMAAARLDVVAVDPMLRVQGFQYRFEENMQPWWDRVCHVSWHTSESYFAGLPSDLRFDLISIDADHEPGIPLRDAQNAAAHLTDRGVILLHDFVGLPVREATTWLMNNGFRVRVYLTVHCVAVAWRSDTFTPPDHVVDRRVLTQDLPARWPDWDRRRES